MQSCGSGMFIPIPDPGSDFFSIPDPVSRVDKIPNSDPHQRTQVVLTQNIWQLSSKIRSVMFIPDPGPWLWIFFHRGSRIRIPDPKRVKKAPDPGSGSATPDRRLDFYLERWEMMRGMSPWSMTAWTWAWFPAVMLERNQTASCNQEMNFLNAIFSRGFSD